MTNNPGRDSSPALRGGFTLIEVLVSSGIGVILLGVVLAVMGVGVDGYSRTMARVDANVEARTALRTIADDVAAIHLDESFGVRALPQGGGAGEIWFSTRKARAAQEPSQATGDLCFVYYYTAVTGPLETDRRPYSRKLYRRLVSSGEVMSKRKAGESLAMPQARPEAPADETIAFNVVKFLLEPMVRAEDGEEGRWIEDGPDPTHLRITLQVADNETAGLLTSVDDWDGETALSRRLLGPDPNTPTSNEHLRTFNLTVPIQP